MKSAAIGSLVGAAMCAVASGAAWVQSVRLDSVIAVIENEAAPLERDKAIEAIALLLPDTEKKESARRLVRMSHEEAKTYHSAWLDTTKAFQRSAEAKGMTALGMMAMFLGVFALMRRDERKAL